MCDFNEIPLRGYILVCDEMRRVGWGTYVGATLELTMVLSLYKWVLSKVDSVQSSEDICPFSYRINLDNCSIIKNEHNTLTKLF